MTLKAKTWLINSAKLAVAAGILYWMIRNEKLDFAQLDFFIERPISIVVPVLGWIAIVLFMGAYRWQILLRGIGLDTPYRRVLHLHWIGLFFNTTMPGAVGGDLIKGVYVIRDHSQFRTKAMLTILLDRVLGLMGLFTLGGIMAIVKLRQLVADPSLSSLVFIVIGSFIATLVFFVLVFIQVDPAKDPILRILRMPMPTFVFFRKIYEALIIYKENPWSLVKALVLSIIIQGYVLFMVMFFTYMINDQIPPVGKLVPVIPVAILVTALPLAPAGMGVGHVAFAQVYRFVGVANGANVFNAYMLSQLVLNLTGVAAYLMFRRQSEGYTQVDNLTVNS